MTVGCMHCQRSELSRGSGRHLIADSHAVIAGDPHARWQRTALASGSSTHNRVHIYVCWRFCTRVARCGFWARVAGCRGKCRLPEFGGARPAPPWGCSARPARSDWGCSSSRERDSSSSWQVRSLPLGGLPFRTDGQILTGAKVHAHTFAQGTWPSLREQAAERGRALQVTTSQARRANSSQWGLLGCTAAGGWRSSSWRHGSIPRGTSLAQLITLTAAGDIIPLPRLTPAVRAPPLVNCFSTTRSDSDESQPKVLYIYEQPCPSGANILYWSLFTSCRSFL